MDNTPEVRHADLRGKNVVITGGAKGIGFATAQAFVRQGARVALLDMDPAALDSAVAELREAGGEALAAQASVTDADAVERVTEALYQRVLELEPQWSPDFLAPADAVKRAQALAAGASRPVVIADTQDNPGAGGDANTTGMLRALVEANAQNAALGLFYDPEAVRQATAAGIGNKVRLRLGGQSGVAGDAPFEGEFVVETLSPGKLRFDGPMMNGMDVDLEAVAGLRLGGVRVVVSATKTQMLDRNLFRVGGVQPEEMAILVVKSSVHFRADFQPIAQDVLVAKAPGPMQADPADLPWTRLQPGIRIKPLGPAFSF